MSSDSELILTSSVFTKTNNKLIRVSFVCVNGICSELFGAKCSEQLRAVFPLLVCTRSYVLIIFQWLIDNCNENKERKYSKLTNA